MKKLFGLIGLVAIFAGGAYYYYVYKQNLQNPLVQYEKIIHVPSSDQLGTYQKIVKGWIKDPKTAIPYPKGWRTVSMTIKDITFDAVTLDAKNPPDYYVAFAFPKKYIKTTPLIKCLGTAKEKATDMCIVGNNDEMVAYFNMIQWVQDNSIFNYKELLNKMAPTMNL